MDEWPGPSMAGRAGRWPELQKHVRERRVMRVLCVRRLYHSLAWENRVACSTTQALSCRAREAWVWGLADLCVSCGWFQSAGVALV